MSDVTDVCVINPNEDEPIINNNYLIVRIDSDNKDTFTCDLCQVSATSYKILQKHYEGRKHKIRAEREGKTFFCEICQLTANSQKQLNNHLSSIRHKYRLEKKEYDENRRKANGNLGAWIILFGIACLFINFLLIFRICL